MREVVTFVDNRMQNDTYLLIDNNDAIIIDPSFNNKRLIDFVAEKSLNIVAILLTHGHYDHFAGVEDLGNRYHCPYYISEEDEDFLYDRSKSYALVLPKSKPELYPETLLQIADFRINILKTPGHTPGSVVLVWDNNMFSGDFIFHGDVGRTDLKGSSPHSMEESLKQFAEITGDYIIYPGHEESTTLSKEKRENPYLNRYVK